MKIDEYRREWHLAGGRLGGGDAVRRSALGTPQRGRPQAPGRAAGAPARRELGARGPGAASLRAGGSVPGGAGAGSGIPSAAGAWLARSQSRPRAVAYPGWHSRYMRFALSGPVTKISA
jgi:hypothetical protein